MIIRREHKGNFAIVPNAVFEDQRLSVEAKGLLGYLLSRPPNWRVRHSHLRKTLGLGRQKFQRAIKELIVAGYASRDDEQPRNDDNQFSCYNYVIRDVPSDVSVAVPLSGLPQQGSRSRKPADDNKKDSNKTDLSNTPPKPSPNLGRVTDESDDWEEFEKDWAKPILRPRIARQLWGSLTPTEKQTARCAARGYNAWHQAQPKPRARIAAKTLLRQRGCWDRFAELDPSKKPKLQQATKTFIEENSPAWRALNVLLAICGSPPLQACAHQQKRGAFTTRQITTAIMALERFAGDDPNAWQFVAAGSRSCGAWREWLQLTDLPQITVGYIEKELRPGKVVSDWPVRERGLRVPCQRPPDQKRQGSAR
jgi:hypothetical protein